MTHAFGRNAAWGLWKIPLEGVSLEVVPAERGTDLRFRCDEGAACIRAGALDDTPERISSHAVRYDRADDARIMLGQIEALRTACNGG